jgi:hypothetical protein
MCTDFDPEPFELLPFVRLQQLKLPALHAARAANPAEAGGSAAVDAAGSEVRGAPVPPAEAHCFAVGVRAQIVAVPPPTRPDPITACGTLGQRGESVAQAAQHAHEAELIAAEPGEPSDAAWSASPVPLVSSRFLTLASAKNCAACFFLRVCISTRGRRRTAARFCARFAEKEAECGAEMVRL